MIRLLLTGLLCVLAGSASNAAVAQVACGDPAYRQFDFWLGEWVVLKPDGTIAGTSRIEKEYGGCVVHERYVTPNGYSGESLNTYDAPRMLWHQTWVDNAGALLLLEGHLIDGRIVLEGSSKAQSGPDVKHRITWTPNSDGSVRQFWESSDSSGKWTVAFVGLYKRKDGK